MNPVALAMMALQLGGQITSAGNQGQNQYRSLDPAWLKSNFGAGAVNQELMDLYNRAINSVQGQQMMTSAQETGQQMTSDIARAAGAAGLGGGGGATGGTDVLAGAMSGQAGSNLERGVRASMMQSMLPVAQQIVQGRLQAYMGGEQLQSSDYFARARAGLPMNPAQAFGDLAANYGSAGLATLQNRQGQSPGGGVSNDYSSLAPGTAFGPGGPINPVTGAYGNSAGVARTEGPGQAAIAPSMRRMMTMPRNIGGAYMPSMASVQGQMAGAGGGGGRFYSKMSRFGGVPSAVQPAA